MFKYSVILTNVGSASDRYMTCGYGRSYTNAELFERLSAIDHVTGVELIGGANITKENVNEIKEYLDKYNLTPTSIIPDHFGKPIWGKGAFTSFDPNVRRAAVEETCNMIDIAKDIGCPLINIWNGQDGYDYPFQVDYDRIYGDMVEGLRECAQYDRDIKISIEYKVKEPRNHSLIPNASSTLLLIWT